MARLRVNDIGDPSGIVNPITLTSGVTTTATWVSSPGFPTIVAPDYYVIVVEEGATAEEIMYLTAYTSGGTTGTVLRAQEGSSGVTHTTKAWIHGPTVQDFKSGPTVVIAASNAPANAQARADYICSGTADQTTINAAISAIGGPGTIELTPGTFNLSASNVPVTGIEIFGHGASTIINAVYALQTLTTQANCTANGTTTITFTGTNSNITYGQLVTGTGVPANTIVTGIAVATNTTLTLSNAVIAGTITLTFQCYGVYPCFDIYDQHTTSSGGVATNSCHIHDLVCQSTVSQGVQAVMLTGFPGGARGQAARTLATGFYVNGSHNTIENIQVVGLQTAACIDIYNRIGTLQQVDTGASAIVAGQNTLTSAALTTSAANPAQIGDAITVIGQTGAGNFNNTVFGYITSISGSVITIDKPFVTSIPTGATATLVSSQPNQGRAYSNWFKNIDCTNTWCGITGNWTEQNHLEGIRGNFAESFMANMVGPLYVAGSTSPAHAVYIQGAGNENLDLFITDCYQWAEIAYSSGATGMSVSGSTITGTFPTGSGLVGCSANSSGGGGVLAVNSTVTSQSTTQLGLSQPATTAGSLQQLVILNTGSSQGTTTKIGGILGARIHNISASGTNGVASNIAPIKFVEYSQLTCHRGMGLMINFAAPVGYMRECIYEDMLLDYDPSNVNPSAVQNFGGVFDRYSNIVITTSWQSALVSDDGAVQFSGQSCLVNGVIINHRGHAQNGIWCTASGGHILSDIVGYNVNLLVWNNSGVTIPNFITYNPGATITSGNPNPLCGINNSAQAFNRYNPIDQNVPVTISAAGTFTPDITSTVTYVLNVTTNGAITIANPANVWQGAKLRLVIQNNSEFATPQTLNITWGTAYNFLVPWVPPQAGNTTVIDFAASADTASIAGAFIEVHREAVAPPPTQDFARSGALGTAIWKPLDEITGSFAGSGVALNTGDLWVEPVFIARDQILTGIAMDVTAAGTAAVIAFGVYNDDGTGTSPQIAISMTSCTLSNTAYVTRAAGWPGILPGMIINDTTTAAHITAGTTVEAVIGTTLVMSQSSTVTSTTVDTLSFGGPYTAPTTPTAVSPVTAVTELNLPLKRGWYWIAVDQITATGACSTSVNNYGRGNVLNTGALPTHANMVADPPSGYKFGTGNVTSVPLPAWTTAHHFPTGQSPVLNIQLT